MIIQIHTPTGIINLDTEKNTEENFTRYGLDKAEYTKSTIEERMSKLESDIAELKT